VLGIDNDEKEDTRSKVIWAASIPAQKKKKSLLSFLFYFHFLLSIIKKCDLAGMTNMMHLVLW